MAAGSSNRKKNMSFSSNKDLRNSSGDHGLLPCSKNDRSLTYVSNASWDSPGTSKTNAIPINEASEPQSKRKRLASDSSRNVTSSSPPKFRSSCGRTDVTNSFNVSVKESENANKSVNMGDSNTKTNLQQAEEAPCGFSGRLSSDSEKVSDNIVPGDTDPLSRLYSSTPTCTVHVKSTMQGFNSQVVRRSLYQHLVENDIKFEKIIAYCKNCQGFPFECMCVAVESSAQAEEWFLKTNRKIALQHTPEMKADYFLYFADRSWDCKNCFVESNQGLLAVRNAFFRSLCFNCFCHRSGSFTSVRLSSAVTKYLGLCKLPPSVDENNVMQHLPKVLRKKCGVRSVRIIDDPEMNCCCGLVVIEMPSRRKAKNVRHWFRNLKTNALDLKYIALDTDPMSLTNSKVIQWSANSTENVKFAPNQWRAQGSGGFEESHGNRSHRPTRDINRRQGLSSSRLFTDDEIGIPLGFDEYSLSPDSFEDLEETDRIEEYNSRQDGPHQHSEERSSSPRHDNMSPIRTRDLIPNRGSSYRVSHVSQHRGSRAHRSYTLRANSRTSPYHRVSPSHRLSASRYFSSVPPPSSTLPISAPSRVPQPDGSNNGCHYPPPDPSTFRQFETMSGLQYDSTTSLYYDPQTKLFYNRDLKIYLKYDPKNAKYVKVS